MNSQSLVKRDVKWKAEGICIAEGMIVCYCMNVNAYFIVCGFLVWNLGCKIGAASGVCLFVCVWWRHFFWGVVLLKE